MTTVEFVSIATVGVSAAGALASLALEVASIRGLRALGDSNGAARIVSWWDIRSEAILAVVFGLLLYTSVSVAHTVYEHELGPGSEERLYAHAGMTVALLVMQLAAYRDHRRLLARMAAEKG